MTKSTMLSLLILVVTTLHANVPKGDDVTLEQLQQTEHPIEKDAPAAFLINKTAVEYDFQDGRTFLRSEYHVRIKVYKEKGEKYATFSIPLHGDGGVREKLTSIKGFTYNAVDGKVERVKLEKGEIFYEETEDKLTTVKFALPNVRSGSIIDVKYSRTSPYVRSIDKFFFQHYIPVEYSEYEMGVPEYFSMSPVPKGFVALETEKRTSSVKGFGEVIYTFKASNVPSIKKDDYVLNVNDYRGSLKYEISSVQFPNSSMEKLSGDWNYVAQSLMSNKHFGGAIGAHGKLYNEIVAQATGSEDEKIAFLYDYVRSNFTWNEYHGKYATQSAKELMKTKTGNVADLNILLLNLLQKAGISADAVLTRHRFAGILNSNFPSSSELNYFLVRTNFNGESVFLDATSKNVHLGQLPIRAVNINALVLNKNSGTIIPMKNPNVNKRKFIGEYTIDLETNTVQGTCKGRLEGFAAVKYRQSLDDQNEEADEDNQDLESEEEEDEEFEDVQVENEFVITSAENVFNLDKPIGYEAEEKNYKMLSKIGDELFIDADLDMGINKNPFTDEKRVFPTFYNYKQDWVSVSKLTVPEGYEVKSLPENVSLALPDNLGKFKYVTSQKDNVITVQYIFKINRDYFLDNEYLGLKQLYNLIITKQKEKIILAKVGSSSSAK